MSMHLDLACLLLRNQTLITFLYFARTDIDLVLQGLEISTSQAGPGGQKITSPIFFFARPLLILDKKTQLQRKRDS